MDIKQKSDLVKDKVSIPKYFDTVVVNEMPHYYLDYSVDFFARPTAKCPLHGEDTPSFRWYEETNTFYCFGCRAGGDIINLHRKFMETINGELPNFEDSLNFLYENFVKGDNETVQLKRVQVEIELKSSTLEVSRLSKYIADIEKQLHREFNMPGAGKIEIYESIDKVVQLVALDKINATEGMKYIKQTVKNVISGGVQNKKDHNCSGTTDCNHIAL